MNALLLVLCLGAGRGARYEPAARVAYVESALTAVRSSGAKVRADGYDYLSAMERGACASDNDRLRADCLIAAARRFCRSSGRGEGRRCPPLMDVIAANVLSERELITAAQRYEIMRREKDYRSELLRQVHRIYGSLAVQLRLSEGDAGTGLPAKIDRFCVETADRSSLSWQTCAAALVWFVGKES